MIVDGNKHFETRDDRLLMLKAVPGNGEVSAQALVCTGVAGCRVLTTNMCFSPLPS